MIQVSIEAMEQIAQAEKLAQEKQQEAAVKAKQIVADAGREGRLFLEQKRKSAEEQAKAAMVRAEQEAEVRAKKILEETFVACDEIRKKAEKRLETAAAGIVKRIVSN